MFTGTLETAGLVLLSLGAIALVVLLSITLGKQFLAGQFIAQEDPRGNESESADTKAKLQSTRRLREIMVAEQLAARDIVDARVLEAMRNVPRHLFVPHDSRHLAYSDMPLQIGYGQTISQPYIVALMTQLAATRLETKALEIGTGSGYQACVLGELVREVYTIEIVEPLADQARRRLAKLGCENVQVLCGDGYQGLPEQAPFDVILLAAAPDHIPQPLVAQLAPGGHMVLPVGDYSQRLLVIQKAADGTVQQHKSVPVTFVPMTGEAQHPSELD